MFYHAKNRTLKISDTTMDYAVFGTGQKALVLIPGLSLQRVKGHAFFLACMYRIFANKYKVYVFDRREEIPEGYTIRDIAKDVALGMKKLGIKRADVMGISQGGMVAQYLALDYPKLVHKLVLAVTVSRENPTMHQIVQTWIRLSEKNDSEAILMHTMKHMYSDQFVKRYGFLFPLCAKIGRQKDTSRFTNLAKACFSCDTYDELENIKCPVFVIGGKKDRILTGAASEEIAEKLGCEIYMYQNLGHSAYEEARDFNRKVLKFLEKEEDVC